MHLRFPDNSEELNAQVYKYIKVNCSVNKILGLCPGLAFTGRAGVRDVNKFFQTRVRGLSYFSDDVPGVFRDFSFGFWKDLIITVGKKRRVYM
jgi:hypothetical protein